MTVMIYMRKIRLVTLAAALVITWFGGSYLCSTQPVNAQTNTAASMPAGKAIDAAPRTSAGGAAVSGGKSVTPTAKPGTYVVRTVWKNAPLSNVRVKWWRQVGDASPELVGDTIRFGTAIFRPASGSYFLTAEWRADGNFARARKPGDRFAWFGGNPLLISPKISEMITMILEEVPPTPQLSSPPSGTGVSGRVTLDGTPIANVGVYAYAKTGSGFKGDDFQATVRTNAKGEFSIELPPDRYYLLARLRADNSVDLGPLHKEDLLGYDPGNPVDVTNGHYSVSVIPAARLKMVKSRTESSAFLPGTIEGRIVDCNGHPVPGVYAALYENPSMAGRSVFRSEPVGTDGRFKLIVPVPGSYFLGARNGYGSPAAGVWLGSWVGSSDHSILIKSGEILTGVEIVVNQLLQELKPPENK